jgi:hypothetical protein
MQTVIEKRLKVESESATDRLANGNKGFAQKAEHLAKEEKKSEKTAEEMKELAKEQEIGALAAKGAVEEQTEAQHLANAKKRALEVSFSEEGRLEEARLVDAWRRKLQIPASQRMCCLLYCQSACRQHGSRS